MSSCSGQSNSNTDKGLNSKIEKINEINVNDINLKSFKRFSEADFLEDFKLQVLGATNNIKALLPKMTKHGKSSIVMFSTIAVQSGYNFHSQVAISKGAIEVTKQRGVLHAEVKNILDETETFDTILLLMNGTGIFQELTQISKYLSHLKHLLKPNGQILIDSSDIKYMYEDEDGGMWLDLNQGYPGE